MLGLKKLGKAIFGSANERYLKKCQPKVDAINALEAEYEQLSDDELKAKTDAFKQRYQGGASLDDLLVEAFATVREASKRALGLRHYDVQLIGGMVLHDRAIAEMKTGEGKTLVATLPAYLNALTGKGVHVVTVNDYLANRDADWMGKLYRFLGLSTGVIVPGLDDDFRRGGYAADITYGTNNEFGFDYLRDNMKMDRSQMVQRDPHFAIIDEVDSILIDEARTPLIISGPTEDKTDMYVAIDAIMQDLNESYYEKDEKAKHVQLTEEGVEAIEDILRERGLLVHGGMYDYENVQLVHHVEQALRAHTMFERDTDYIVRGGQVIIIDEFTGRMMDGRRWSGGLHQAVEAKEGADIQPENQTMASITFQNLFRMYPKLGGMTGTAATEAEEFAAIYGLNVVEIPTHRPIERKDEHDEFYRTAAEKNTALITEIRDAQAKGQPVLVGTVSIEKSEYLSDILKKEKIPHNVLNARFHEEEAYIVAQAGRFGAVTIATNMAGRGTDIQLGGNVDMQVAEARKEDIDANVDDIRIRVEQEVEAEKQRVLAAGGLYIIGTERHESRRIDNQLRGRAGRQGDPGRTKFFLSLQDDMMRIFGPERMDAMLLRLGIEEGEAIIHPWINKAIEKAQQKVEARNYELRKNIVKYDDVMNDQRKVIYDQRREIMDAENVGDTIVDMRADVIDHVLETSIPPKSYPDNWNWDGLREDLQRIFTADIPADSWQNEDGLDEETIRDRLAAIIGMELSNKRQMIGDENWARLEKQILLEVVDSEWKDHLQNLDHLRQAVSLRAYGQRDPLNEYKTEAFTLFEQMLYQTRERVVGFLSAVRLSTEAEMPHAAQPTDAGAMMENHPVPDQIIGSAAEPQPVQSNRRGPGLGARMAGGIDPNDPSTWGHVPRNAPCPCGSGKKYKHCHGAMDNLETGLKSPASPAANPYANVGRNDPCPCGSGKKFKHCHGRV